MRGGARGEWRGSIHAWLGGFQRVTATRYGTKGRRREVFGAAPHWTGGPGGLRLSAVPPSGGMALQKLTSLIKISPRLHLKNHRVSARADGSHPSQALMPFAGAEARLELPHKTIDYEFSRTRTKTRSPLLHRNDTRLI